MTQKGTVPFRFMTQKGTTQKGTTQKGTVPFQFMTQKGTTQKGTVPFQFRRPHAAGPVRSPAAGPPKPRIRTEREPSPKGS